MRTMYLAGLAVLALAACGTGDVGTVRDLPAQTALPAEAATSTPAPANKQLKFGQEYSGGGYVISLSTPQPYKPGPHVASLKPIKRAVQCTFRITNNTDKPIQPVQVGLSIAASANEQEAEQLYDGRTNIGPPTADVLPGKSATWQVAFNVPAEPAELIVQVAPDSLGERVYFIGKV